MKEDLDYLNDYDDSLLDEEEYKSLINEYNDVIKQVEEEKNNKINICLTLQTVVNIFCGRYFFKKF